MMLITATPTTTVAAITANAGAAFCVDLGDTTATISNTASAVIFHQVRCVDATLKLWPTVTNQTIAMASNSSSAPFPACAVACAMDAAAPTTAAASGFAYETAAVPIAIAAAAGLVGLCNTDLAVDTPTTKIATAVGSSLFAASELQNTRPCSRPPASTHAEPTAAAIAKSVCGMKSADYDAWLSDYTLQIGTLNECVRCGLDVIDRIGKLQSGAERWCRTDTGTRRAEALVRSGKAYIPRTKFPKITRNRRLCGRR